MKLRLAVLVALVLMFPAQALAGLAAPVALAPDDGLTFASVPALGWSPVAGADHYAVGVSSTENFTAPVAGGELSTSNTWITLAKALPYGHYWWRVRAATKLGALGPWSSPATSFVVALPSAGVIAALAPPDTGSLTYPAAPTVRWTPIAGAASYRLKAGSDAGLTALDGVANFSQATDAAEYTFTGALTPGATYYWQVVPIDAEKSEGTPSPVYSFTWHWTSTTATRYLNLRDPAGFDVDPPVVDPQFSWDPIPGAVRYQVQVGSSQSLSDSIFLDRTTVGTKLSPIANLPNNRFYWHVRGIDAAGNNGVWNAYGGDPLNPLSFLKSFYTSAAHPITHLRLVDQSGTTIAGTRPDVGSPLITWDPMPGASAYEVEVRLAQMTYDNQTPPSLLSAVCTNAVLGEYWDDIVAVNAWTPLGIKPANTKGPFPNNATLSFDGIVQMVLGHHYCVRVRPYSADSVDGGGVKAPVYGAWTELDGGWNAPSATVSFHFTGYPTCSVSCVVDYPVAATYLLPAPSSTVARTPYFTWAADPNASGYFVIVAQDAALTNVIDYAYVHGNAYAPRTPRAPVSYPDETTRYYWAVLPSATANGAGGPIDATKANPQLFSKTSVPPALTVTSPAAGQRPTFVWSAVEGAKTYRLVVASDDKFSSIVETLLTPATSYTPEVTYPAGDLYWRVAAVDWDDIQLSWSATGTFKNVLPAPTVPAQATHADMVPTFLWNPVPGAIGYKVETNSPPGVIASVKKTWGPYAGAGVTFLKLDGTGIWRWRVQAEFPGKTASVPGDWSPLVDFDNTMSPPTGVSAANGGHGLLLSWQPTIGAAHYRVEVSRRPDMAVTYVERVLVDSPAYAPAMIASGYRDGGRLYWHVAAVDETKNVGKWSDVRSFLLPERLIAHAAGLLRKGKKGSIIVTVTNVQRVSLAGATVRISGAGIARTLRTTASGSAVWKGAPRRAGTVTVTVTKPGYQTMVVTIVVR